RQALADRKTQLEGEINQIIEQNQEVTADESTQVDSENVVEDAQVDAVQEQTQTAEGLVETTDVQQSETFTETEQAELVNTVSQIQGVTDAPTFVNSIRNSLSDSNIRQSRIQELEQRF